MISGIGSSLPLLPQSRRDVTENTQEQRRELQQRSAPGSAERGSADANAAEQVLAQPDVRRTEALQGIEENRFRRQREQDELPLGNQQALSLYQSNQSTLTQDKDTGELVGIDVFV